MWARLGAWHRVESCKGIHLSNLMLCQYITRAKVAGSGIAIRLDFYSIDCQCTKFYNICPWINVCWSRKPAWKFLCPLFGQSVNRRTDWNNILRQKLNKLARFENNSREIGLHDLYRLFSYGYMHRDRSLYIERE